MFLLVFGYDQCITMGKSDSPGLIYRNIVVIISILFIYFGINLVVVILAVIAGCVAAAFHGEIGSIVKSNMNETLITRYRNNTHNTTLNRIVTQAWDRMQVRLNCCAVEDEGWEVYQQSSWYQYKLHNNYEISKIELVPESCCRRATYDWERIINQRICQTTQGGPPKTSQGSPNHFLNYDGCYNAAKKALSELIWFVFGFGFVLAALIIGGMVSAICLAKKIKKAQKEKVIGGRSPNRTPGRRIHEY
ncbi:hypothetical protein EB796_011062 [Bugula neritina]|uniref:Tetraspanin n=1 Tax=Bugula neritina TaxID=10212 RepID=A0A7J7JXN5_BUGNE|nr:hypothetical protein EB796_011062 [Bugula neritina]